MYHFINSERFHLVMRGKTGSTTYALLPFKHSFQDFDPLCELVLHSADGTGLSTGGLDIGGRITANPFVDALREGISGTVAHRRGRLPRAAFIIGQT
jgi:hypothetical protein